MVRPFLKTLLGLVGLLLPLAAAAQTLARRDYTQANGLMQASTYCLAQDGYGRLWMGTQAGVCVYNGVEFKTYGGAQGLADSHVRAVAAAPDGPTVWLGQQYAGLAALGAGGRIRTVRVPGLRMPGRLTTLWAAPGQVWVGTEEQGIWLLRYRPGTRPDTTVRHWGTAQGLPTDSVEQLGPGLHGRQWAATPRGILVFEAGRGQPLPAERAALPPELRQQPATSFWRVSDSVAWVGTRRGLLRVSATGPGGWRLRRYTTAQGLCAKAIRRVVQDAAGRVWASTAVGLCQGQPGAGGLRFRCHAQPPNPDADRDRDLLPDREGNLWVAFAGGLTQYLADGRFSQYSTADGLLDNAVNAIAQPRPDELWIGTHQNISILPLTPAGPRPPARPLAVPARDGRPREVMSLLTDHRGGVWAGLFRDGARRYDMRTGRWASYDRVPGLAGETVSSMAEDRRGRIWLVTHHQGVTVHDPAMGTFRTFRRGDASGLTSDNFWQIHRDRAGQLWLASDDDGLLQIDTDHDTFRRAANLPDHLSLGSISDDAAGQLWLGPVSMPLLRYMPATSRLHRYDARSGLQSINPYFVQCDSASQVWVGTHLGVDVFDPRTGQARSYGRAEGFSGGETNENAVLLDASGRLWMGTVGGLMGYDAHHQPRPPAAPPAYLTGLRVGLRDTVLPAGAVLPYALNNLSFDFLGVSLARPGSVRYQYRLRGLNDTWVGPVATTSTTYTNLEPGHYIFEVRAASEAGGWSARPAGFAFSIRPPWWRTWWAYALYLGGFGWLIYAVRSYTRTRERDRAERRLEQQALTHLQELDRVKTDFFTNVSHELRTPLTLILGPAEELATEAAEPVVRQQGELILRNARKLLALINQLLDLSKLEAGALRLQPTTGDAGAAVRNVVAAFTSLAESRRILLRGTVPAMPVSLVFDAAKLDEVLTNLIANALRFTPAGGFITVSVVEAPPTADAPAGSVVLAVRDTGAGIAPEDLPHLFDRFYQAGNGAEAGQRTGTGIGLALVRELVALHGGTVSVASQPGAGSTFTVRLPRNLRPVEIAATNADPAVTATANARYALAASTIDPAAVMEMASASSEEAEADVVLIIEDNDDVREFIRTTLAPAGYRLLLATDGSAGVALARAEVPDLVVSDVMMPGLTGYEVCAQLKTDPATSHVPVVLLTARSGDEAKLEGLETGADAFLAKPFNPRELRAQVRNLLALRQRLHARLLQTPVPEEAKPTILSTAAEDVAAAVEAAAAPATALPDSQAAHAAAVAGLPSLDQEFLRRIEEAVLGHLGDEDFGVDELGSAIGMSRTQVHRKLKALTGQSPGEHIRGTRLHRARALLRAQVGTVAEVAYQVGFGSPAAFSTAFSRQFGYPPSAAFQQRPESAGRD